MLSATLNQCKKPNQQLLIPITVWIGMEQAFIGADFTQASHDLLCLYFMRDNRSNHISLVVMTHYYRLTFRARSAFTPLAT